MLEQQTQLQSKQINKRTRIHCFITYCRKRCNRNSVYRWRNN